MVLLALLTVAGLVGAGLMLQASVPLGVFFLIAPLLTGLTAWGVWRGYRGSLVMGVVLGVLLFPVGLAIVGLLLGPKSSRDWFNPAISG